ncbi:DeoR/GlpR family DNA-binding transcription regulator [Nocardioides sp. AX2bis]|uniref:DeoR/GlpR family DNA-binding transcription regulator n=1 Tax=Nocardioides sp. AX2bis TaxID=2653157 RepID=UPI0012F2D018|nr:DeoR/GlpR family DNA-binding transcription regulator [Nocardioides sp. AX2bis]VXC35938.1 DeoR family transcriptional regulator [Nocardioides sp. AX2bis]
MTGAVDRPQSRRDQIRARVADAGFVRIDALADEHGVSAMTIHRDLEDLQGHGWLRKVRGGATAVPSSMHHGDVRHRLSTMTAAKQALARAAVLHVEPGQAVLMDESTTALAMADLVAERAPLTVVTHFLPLINRLTGDPGVELIALGGSYFAAYDAFLGLRTAEAIASLRADLLISSTTAVRRGHCYHQSQETVAVKRAMMDAADTSVLLVDSSKFDRRGLHHLAPLTAFDHVLVDDGLPVAEQRELRKQNVNLTVVPVRTA